MTYFALVNKSGKSTLISHFGKERTTINESELGATIDVARAAKMFGKKSNISFDPELQDPNTLVLLP